VSAETTRIEAFSDGVFAIAITLLILEIKIPAGSGPLSEQLIRQWPSYLSFLISFTFIGIMWINHHRLFTHIARSDDVLLILNLLLLLGVVVVPFPTAVLATRLGGPDQLPALILYNSTYVFIAFIFNLLWRYAASEKHQLLAEDVDPTSVQRISRQYAFGPVLYLVCLGLSWLSAGASLALGFALACFFALPPHVVASERSNGRN
jgi:uncharacterized membrane protein